MEQYISKSVVLAEIERRMKLRQNGYIKYNCLGDLVAFEELEYLRDEFLPTLEVKELPIWEKISPDTGQTTLYKDGGKSYLERFGYRIDLKDLDKLPKKKS